MNTENKFVYGVKVLSEEKKQFYYLWHVEKGNDQNCKSLVYLRCFNANRSR